MGEMVLILNRSVNPETLRLREPVREPEGASERERESEALGARGRTAERQRFREKAREHSEAEFSGLTHWWLHLEAV